MIQVDLNSEPFLNTGINMSLLAATKPQKKKMEIRVVNAPIFTFLLILIYFT